MLSKPASGSDILQGRKLCRFPDQRGAWVNSSMGTGDLPWCPVTVLVFLVFLWSLILLSVCLPLPPSHLRKQFLFYQGQELGYLVINYFSIFLISLSKKIFT